MIAISKATKRTLPRPFAFHWGKGQVFEETSIACSIDKANWEPTIQLLRYNSGEEMLRICVYDKKRFTRMPPLLSREQLKALGKEASKNPGIMHLLREIAR